MKTTMTLLLFLTILLSCEDEDEVSLQQARRLIIGEWGYILNPEDLTLKFQTNGEFKWIVEEQEFTGPYQIGKSDLKNALCQLEWEIRLDTSSVQLETWHIKEINDFYFSIIPNSHNRMPPEFGSIHTHFIRK